MASPSPKTNQTPVSHDDISPSLRKKLEQLFKFGSDKLKIGDRDYANQMYSQCAKKDPSNLGYVEAMLENLNAKFEGKKKKCRVKENRAPFKKALAAEEWREVLKLGPDLLKDNPWDTATLRGMADACAALHFNEVELRYLKNALEGAPKDVDVNRHCATSLARMGQFDQAIACWHRIEEKAKKEALKNISDLTMAKTRHATGYGHDDGDESTTPTAPAKKSEPTKPAEPEQVPEEKTEQAPAKKEQPNTTEKSIEDLEAEIVRRPEEVENYIALADRYDADGNYREAERVLRRAMPVSGGDLQIRERLEKAQIRRSKSHLVKAENEFKKSPNEETKSQLEKTRRLHNRLELDIYSARSERYPDDVALKYEVGVRLKRAGNYAEAVPFFDDAAADDRCQGPALLARGECLQQIRQYTAALKSYESAAESGGNPPTEVVKLALYRAGVLAVGLKDPPRAKTFLKKLVEIDANYRDAASRLDKLG